MTDIQNQIGFGHKHCHIALVIMVAKPIESLIYCLPLAQCAKRKKVDINHIDQNTIHCQNYNLHGVNSTEKIVSVFVNNRKTLIVCQLRIVKKKK